MLETITETPTRDFISDCFEGVTVLRTTCLECEYVTERKESFMDICVPIVNENPSDDGPQSPSAFFASTLMEVDFLRDTNKYWSVGILHDLKLNLCSIKLLSYQVRTMRSL